MAPEEEYNHFDLAKVAGLLDKEGVLVNTGAHGQREGLGLHWELWMLVQGGLSPHQAFRCATANPAKTLMDRDPARSGPAARRPDRHRGQPAAGHPPVGEGDLTMVTGVSRRGDAERKLQGASVRSIGVRPTREEPGAGGGWEVP
jgi:hypothetical protein